MRLLHSSTIQFRDFQDTSTVHYAILSHTWGEDEVSFQDMQNRSAEGKVGFTKIKSCCALAARHGWEYVWIDTCCVDKTSSTELSEAINSMFEWYRRAAVCYAYLADVPNGKTCHDGTKSAFRQSRWFTRGWTLQELLAPRNVIFCDQNWEDIGTKSSLQQVISEVTGIKRSDMIDFKDANVAVKMSWASKRKTTRIEDAAYCLMGLFDVHMPLLYGEGKNAFLRLQLEILKMSDDETIFAWDDLAIYNWDGYLRETGLLAPSPARFRNSGDIRRMLFDADRPIYSMTNKGMRMELLLWRETDFERPGFHYKLDDVRLYLAPLNCTRHPEGHPVAIYLRTGKQGVGNAGNEFTRGFPRGPRLATMQTTFSGYVKEGGRKIVYVKQVDNDPVQRVNLGHAGSLRIRYPSAQCQILQIHQFSPTDAGEGEMTDTDRLWVGRVPGEAVVHPFAARNVYGVKFKTTKAAALNVNELSEVFVVLLYSSLHEDVTNFVITDTMETLKEVAASLRKQANTSGYESDRIFRFLPSGKAIHIALRWERSHDGVPHNEFVANITIEAHTGLLEPHASRY